MTPGLYRTRSGHKARVLCNDAPGRWPCVGYIILNTDPDAWLSEDAIIPALWGINDRLCGYVDNAEWDIIGPWEDAT